MRTQHTETFFKITHRTFNLSGVTDSNEGVGLVSDEIVLFSQQEVLTIHLSCDGGNEAGLLLIIIIF